MKQYNNTLNEKKFSLNKWIKSLDYAYEIVNKLNIKNYVFIKDFKYVSEYYGSNVDIFIWDENEVKKITAFLQSQGFYLPRIDFEYDKNMLISPGFWELIHKYLPIHIYPYIWWYTLRLNLFKLRYGEIPFKLYDNKYRVFPIEYEVPLILFHAYMEDRKLEEYDIHHLNFIIESTNYVPENSHEILNKEYIDIFNYIYWEFLINKDSPYIDFRDIWKHLKFSLKVKENKIWNKL